MTWNHDASEANWIQLGYLAANVGSILSPLSTGRSVPLSARDCDGLKQQAAFFDAAIAGWSSYDEPALLFQTQENSITYPAGALNTVAEIYTSVHGGPFTDPERFKTDLESYSALLRDIASGQATTTEMRDTAKELLRFLGTLINRAQAESHKLTTRPR